MATIKQVAQIRAEVMRLNLRRPPIFDVLTIEDLADIYNGYGPDSWPARWRAILTWIYRHFKPLALVHDVQFYFSNGSRESWRITLADWKANSAVLLQDRYPAWKIWLAPVRAYAAAKLRASYRALQLGSWPAWQSAHRRTGGIR